MGKSDAARVVKNKYDMYNVEDTFNKFLMETIEEDFGVSRSLKTELTRFLLLAVLAFFILKSYFHKTPFPEDKLWILVCVIVYGLLNLIKYLYEKFIIAGKFAAFTIPEDKFTSRIKGLKGKSGPFKVELSSNVKPFSSDYTLKVFVNGKAAEKTFAYEQFLFVDGSLEEAALKAKLVELLSEAAK